eukprot:m.183179 g.183179  ORF g.183179 m.183179 type:complete len:1098 (+) comp17470_c0_seq1:86-3379(+)
MAYQYVVTAHKPSAVHDSTVGHFTGPEDINLIVNRFTHADIMHVRPEGLAHVLSVPVYGRISCLKLFRPQGAKTDLLLLLTEACQLCVLQYDVESGEILTHAFANCHTRQLRAAAMGQIAVVDPEKRMLGLHLYEGQFKVIRVSADGRSQFGEQIELRLEQKQILDIKFLHDYKRPTVAILHQDHASRHVVVLTVNADAGELKETGHNLLDVDSEANIVIPVPSPYGGFIVVGRHAIVYSNMAKSAEAVAISVKTPMTVSSYGAIDKDGSRILLADTQGNLYMLVVLSSGNAVTGLQLETLGSTSIASSLSYLDDGVVYVGSLFGDSQLVRLRKDKNDQGSFVDVLESFPNIGPVLDMCVVDTDKQGQSQVVTCSGSFKDGSLRVIRNGIGITELATVDIPSVRGVWCVHVADPAKRLMALSFVNQTSFLSVVNDDMEGMDIAGADTTRQTLFFGDVAHQQWVQVTAAGVRLISKGSLALAHEWSAPGGQAISVCHSNGQLLALAYGSQLQLLRVDSGSLVPTTSTTLPHEIACVALSAAQPDGSTRFCAVGLWHDISVRVLALPDFRELHKDVLAGETIPRSLLLTTMDGLSYLMCGLGDGSFCTYSMNAETGQLTLAKRMQLGTQPVHVSEFTRGDKAHVFALCDRPVVVYSTSQKLMFSNVSQNDIKHMSFIDSPALPECLVFVTAESISIGAINEIQNLQIRKIPMGGSVWHVDHQQASRTFLVAITYDAEYDCDLANPASLESKLLLIDDLTFETLHSLPLKQFETVGCIVSCKLGGNVVYVVGSSLARPDEDEPSEGYVRVLRVVDRRISELHVQTVKGGVYALRESQGAIVASIGPSVMVLSWNEETCTLEGECGSFGQVVGVAVKAQGSQIFIGDIITGAILYTYNTTNKTLQELARTSEMWTTELEFVGDNIFLVADNFKNLQLFKRNTESTDQEELRTLEPYGEFHLGHAVNVTRHGTLTMKSKEFAGQTTPILFGTDVGSLGIMLSLTKEDFMLLHELQNRLRKLVKGVGGLDHQHWRSFKSDRRQNNDGSRFFIDGDLIETFLDLPLAKKQEVVSELKVVDAGGLLQPMTAEYLTQRVEDLARLH